MWIFRVNPVSQIYQKFLTKMKFLVKGRFSRTPRTPSESAPGNAVNFMWKMLVWCFRASEETWHFIGKSEKPDQRVHPHSLFRIFVFRLNINEQKQRNHHGWYSVLITDYYRIVTYGIVWVIRYCGIHRRRTKTVIRNSWPVCADSLFMGL